MIGLVVVRDRPAGRQGGLRRERHDGTLPSQHGLLTGAPIGGLTCLFRGEFREKEVREIRLPCERIRFHERLPEQMLVQAESTLKLRLDVLLHPVELAEELFARNGTRSLKVSLLV